MKKFLGIEVDKTKVRIEKYKYDQTSCCLSQVKVRIFDKRNNLIYLESYSGYWARYEYDENNNVTYYRGSTGYWLRRKYDENNNELYYKDSDGIFMQFWDSRDKRKKRNEKV